MLQIFIQVSRAMAIVNPVKNNSYHYTIIKSFRKLIEANYISLRFPKEYAEL
ncbi:hypothetical protein [Pedobacter sp.]|uniref:hypothetical protein n=1 Tax=Pedobacter sp. TaxID=1411316 RepID=UPI003D7F68C1